MTTGSQPPRGTRKSADGTIRYNPTGPAPSSARPATSAAPSAQKLSALPSQSARALAFAAILLGGFLGGLIGYSLARVEYPTGHATAKALASSIGAIFVASGTAVLAVLVLRAMGEWRVVDPTVAQVRLGNITPGDSEPTR